MLLLDCFTNSNVLLSSNYSWQWLDIEMDVTIIGYNSCVVLCCVVMCCVVSCRVVSCRVGSGRVGSGRVVSWCVSLC